MNGVVSICEWCAPWYGGTKMDSLGNRVTIIISRVKRPSGPFESCSLFVIEFICNNSCAS